MQIDSLTRRCCVFGIFRGRSAIYALVLVTVWLALAGQGVWLTAAEDDLESGQEAKKTDVLQLVLEEYEKACDAVRSSKRSEEQRLRFYSDWRERIAEAMKADSKSRYIRAGTVKLLGIANSLGDSETAGQLAARLAAESQTPRERLRWHGEMGEIANARYQLTKDKADADKAIAALALAAADYREIATGQEEPADRNRNVINLCMMAGLQSRALKNHEEAARVFEHVRETLASAPPSSELAALRYDFEYAASSEMLEWLAAKDATRAEKALDSLAARTGMRWPPSYYAHMYVSNLYPQGGKDLRAFIEKWLAGKPRDKWTPFLQFYLARDLFAHNEYAAAQPVFAELKDKYADVFLKADQAAIRIGRGGFYAEILYCLSVIYRKSGDQVQAEAMAAETKALAPEDQRVSDLENAAAAAAKDASRTVDARRLPASASRRLAWLAISGLAVLLIAMLIRRGVHRRST